MAPRRYPFDLHSPIVEQVQRIARYRPALRRGPGGRFQRITPAARASAAIAAMAPAAAALADRLNDRSTDHFTRIEGDWRIGSQSGRWSMRMDDAMRADFAGWTDRILDAIPAAWDRATFHGDAEITVDTAEAGGK